MTTYHYEVLGPQRFQSLIQSLIVAQHPETLCLPVGQPDGGRDAVLFNTASTLDNFTVFQVKFSIDPHSKTDRDAIRGLIKSERKKVRELVQRGATRYVFATNIQGTAHRDVGSIDKTIEEVRKAFGISTHVWWRDDIDKRINQSIDIKWSYPDILKATDLLPLLFRQPEDKQQLESTYALKSYLARQYEADRDVKFKQVDLKRRLTTLFVDLPIGLKRARDHTGPRRQIRLSDPPDIDSYIEQMVSRDTSSLEDDRSLHYLGLAGIFLLKMPLFPGVTRLVIEGAPGQGKSTITQFVCQVNRLRLLRKTDDLQTVNDNHKETPTRIPFRVDLRDYASWILGRHPYTTTGDKHPIEVGHQSLESFLAMQVNWQSGGLTITQHELLELLARSHSVVVLDGFDEVADVAVRKRIVEEICQSAHRLDAHAKSMQIIVTSRPSAFANSPGLPEDEWCHLELADLHRKNIDAYKNKWIEAQDLTESEGRLVSQTLHDKLGQPHLRDLARNPMQLAILLHLIHVQGVALPEKRTTLYEEYMKLFFNREAEKSAIVRDHRELLLSIHGVVAWLLHTQVERGAGSGSITRAALHEEIRSYLSTEEHDPDLAGELVKGTVERVGALVSRVVETFEFEVQPLREYFAARHLYKTAPYSPVGYHRKGTRPERFNAIGGSFYWTNVTRFFCGFYDVGELASLVDGISRLGDQSAYQLINHPRRLAMMLLSDQVFAQAPRAMKRLVSFITTTRGFERLASSGSLRSHRGMGLSETASRTFFFNSCGDKLETEDDPYRCRLLRMAMAANADTDIRKAYWLKRLGNSPATPDLLREAEDLGLIRAFGVEEILRLANDDSELQVYWLIASGHSKYISEDSTLYNTAIKAFFDSRLEVTHGNIGHMGSMSMVATIADLLQPAFFAYLLSDAGDGNRSFHTFSHYYSLELQVLQKQLEEATPNGNDDTFKSFVQLAVDLMTKDFDDWRRSLEDWSTLVDCGLEVAPGSQLMVQFAVLSTAAVERGGSFSWDQNAFRSRKGLVKRLCFARERNGDIRWWRSQLSEVTKKSAGCCLAMLFSWGEPELIAALGSSVDQMIDDLSAEEWSCLCLIVGIMARVTSEARASISEDWFASTGRLSPRTTLLMMYRIKDRDAVQNSVKDWLLDYAGDDQFVLRYAARALLNSEGDIDWHQLRQVSKRARQAGIRVLFPDPGFQSSRIPDDIAIKVLADSGSYCGELLDMCEQSYAMAVGEDAPKVADVASSDGWFTDPDQS